MITLTNLNDSATEWSFSAPNGNHPPFTISKTPQLEGPAKYAIFWGVYRYNKKHKSFTEPPRPSSRKNLFFVDFNFETLLDAVEAINAMLDDQNKPRIDYELGYSEEYYDD